jgi:hypothetical protein
MSNAGAGALALTMSQIRTIVIKAVDFSPAFAKTEFLDDATGSVGKVIESDGCEERRIKSCATAVDVEGAGSFRKLSLPKT